LAADLVELDLDAADIADLSEPDQFFDMLDWEGREPVSGRAARTTIWSVSYCHSIFSNLRIVSNSLGMSNRLHQVAVVKPLGERAPCASNALAETIRMRA